jgi:beta-fructofuranosidase
VWDGDTCHAFYLCASKGLVDPNRRHRYTNVGHAISKDLTNWTVLPDAISPSDSPAFDSWTTWTGSTVKGDDGKWYMYYTGTSREDGGDVQSIGLATSDDLITWQKFSNKPIVSADSQWYEKLGQTNWPDEAWRDPWVYKSPEDNLWHMLITARAKGTGRIKGVVGHATSSDMLSWEVKEPLSEPNQGFAQLEVFQLAKVNGVPLLIFCCGWRELDDDLQLQVGQTDATYSVVCNKDLSDLDFRKAKPFLNVPVYAGRLVQDTEGDWFLLGFINLVDGEFVGEISDPIPVTATIEDGLIPRV